MRLRAGVNSLHPWIDVYDRRGRKPRRVNNILNREMIEDGCLPMDSAVKCGLPTFPPGPVNGRSVGPLTGQQHCTPVMGGVIGQLRNQHTGIPSFSVISLCQSFPSTSTNRFEILFHPTDGKMAPWDFVGDIIAQNAAKVFLAFSYLRVFRVSC